MDLPNEVRVVIAALPKNMIMKVTENHIKQETNTWEPARAWEDTKWHNVILERYYGQNIFEADSTVTWPFLDRIGPERAQMITDFHVHADQVFKHGEMLGPDGPVFQIDRWRCAHPDGDSGRWFLHKDAVSIKVGGDDGFEVWTKLTDVEHIQVVGGDYDWRVCPSELVT